MMDYSTLPVPQRLDLPMAPYAADGYTFGERVRSRIILWARHLGEDILAEPGAPVHAIGAGRVVWSEMRLGEAGKPNWGGIIIVGHLHKQTEQPFYSLYGHMTDLAVEVGVDVQGGQQLGVIAAGSTPDNGWWKKPHLHFGIYTGPWADNVLPGYAKPFAGRTKFKWWQKPQTFIEEYNQ